MLRIIIIIIQRQRESINIDILILALFKKILLYFKRYYVVYTYMKFILLKHIK